MIDAAPRFPPSVSWTRIGPWTAWTIGLGGILVEALGDVRLLPADLGEAAIIQELYKLKAAKVLDGFRGSPALGVSPSISI